MKRLTMVVRCGDVKANAEASIYTLIGEDYSFERMSGADIVKAIKAKKIEVTNMGVTEKGLVSTNGALKNYTTFDMAGNMVGQPRAVVLNRVETEKGLIGYTIYHVDGTLHEVRVPQLVEMAQANMVANGKIRHTQQGDIVASISGLYPLRVMKLSEPVDKSITLDVMFFGSAIKGKHNIKYVGAMVNAKNAAGITAIHKNLEGANAKLISSIKDVTGVDEAAALGIKRTGTAGFYGVFPMDSFIKLVEKADNKIAMPMGSVMIACTDYDADKAESNITIGKDKKPTGKQTGTEKADKALRGYAEKVLEKLADIKVTK